MYNYIVMKNKDNEKAKVNRVSFTTTIKPELLEKFKIYCIRKGKPLNYFIEKYINDLPVS